MTPSFSLIDEFFLQIETAWHPTHWALVFDLAADGTAQSSCGTGIVTMEALRARIRARIDSYPVFRLGADGNRKRPILREYDVETALSCVSSAAVTDERQSQALLGSLLAQPLTRDRPLWRAVLINQAQPRLQRLALLVHHGISDGVAGAGYAALFIDGDDTQLRQLDRYARAERFAAPPPVAANELLRAVRALSSSWKAGVRSRRLTRLTTGSRRAVSALEIPTAKVRREAAAFGAGTSEFLIAAIGAAVADTARAALPTHERPTTLRALLPAMLDNDFRHSGNAMSTVLVNLAGEEADLKHRIATTHAQLATISEKGAALALPAIGRFSSRLPWTAQCRAARATLAILSPDLHVAVNPAYVNLQSVLGRAVTGIRPLSPLLGDPLSATCIVLGKAVHIGIVWDPDALGDSFGLLAARRTAELLAVEEHVAIRQ
jgi:diacylglycerol O-acyltransferase / wax synthase